MKKKIIETMQQVLENAGYQVVVDEDFTLIRENGIDSLTMVSFVIEIEETLGIDLDMYLARIRKACNMRELIEIINECMQ